jgi:transposase
MQDGARCHAAKTTQAFFARAGVRLLAGHPAASPDLNPIEALWAELNRRISLLAPFDDDSLIEAAYDAWASFSQAEIDAFVLHQKTACEAVVRARGL